MNPMTFVFGRSALTGVLAAGSLLAAATIADRAAAANAAVQGTTLVVNGDDTADRIALRLEAGVPTNLQVDFGDDGTADATVDRATFDRILVTARRGDDRVRIDDANGVFTDTELTTIQGGRGDDTMLGGAGNETFFGGPGNDVVDGNQGADLAFLGDGNDAFIWDPGDGSDVIEGQRGDDTLDFRGSNGAEVFDVSANGPRLRFFRNLGNIVMDTDGVEVVKLAALGGADATTVNNLRGTDVRRVYIDLAPTLGASGGDGLADSVTVNATAGDDLVAIRRKDSRAVVFGLQPTVVLSNTDPTLDTLTLNLLGGDDAVRFGRGLGTVIKASVNA